MVVLVVVVFVVGCGWKIETKLDNLLGGHHPNGVAVVFCTQIP